MGQSPISTLPLSTLPQKSPTQAAQIPTNKERYSTHSTAVAQREPRVAQTQAAESRRTPQSLSPEGYHNSITPTSGCSVARNHFHWSTFSFSESRTAFSFARKRKSGFTRRGYAPSVRRHSRQRLGCGPSWASGKQSPVGQAKKRFSPQRPHPILPTAFPRFSSSIPSKQKFSSPLSQTESFHTTSTLLGKPCKYG